MKIVLSLIAVVSLLNAGLLWFWPQQWYAAVPGVVATGPFNVHFVRDAALAFTASGAMLLWGARRERRDVAICGALWLCLHAVFHIWIWWQRGLPFDVVLATNVFGIQLPAWGALWAARRLPAGG